jgi:hypothetical protein
MAFKCLEPREGGRGLRVCEPVDRRHIQSSDAVKHCFLSILKVNAIMRMSYRVCERFKRIHEVKLLQLTYLISDVRLFSRIFLITGY